MSAFDELNAAGQSFSETVMGESFTYTTPAGTTTSGLVGVFNQPAITFTFEEFSQKAAVDMVCVSGKTQWGAVVPANRGTISYGSITYTIDGVSGGSSTGEPCFTIDLRVAK